MGSDSQAGRNRLARWLADDAFSPRPPDLAVYRYKGMIWILPVFGVAFLSVNLPILATLSPGREFGGYVGIPAFGWGAASIGWLVTVGTAVRVRPDALIIDNMVVRHVIPWERFAGLDVEQSMGMFARLDDGGVIRSSSFGRSLVDAMKGYGHMRETLGKIRADCRAARASHLAVSPPPAYLRRVNVPWRPILGFLVFFEAFAWIAFAAHGG
jgi:hypothetical protein